MSAIPPCLDVASICQTISQGAHRRCPVERLTIDHIAATKVERSTAFVSLGAALQASDHVTKFSGPMQLRKIAGRWRVVGYLRNGAPLAPTIHSVSDAPTVQADEVSF